MPAEVLATLAVIEQTDDGDFMRKRAGAIDEVLSQYGLKREEVVRQCPEARLDPNFERGATDLLNAMKAAICLFDIELSQMRADIRLAYRDNKEVLGIFPVAAYNGGPRNVAKLYGVMKRMGVNLDDLRPPGEQPPGMQVNCPCLWKRRPPAFSSGLI